jgi:hypothetical protein
MAKTDPQEKKSLPSRRRGRKSTKVDLKRDALALTLSETLDTMMAQTEEAPAKRDEKQHWEKEGVAATFIDLTKQVIDVQKLEVVAKFLAKHNRIMFADLSLMDLEQNAWFEKKRVIIRERDALSPIFILIYFISFELVPLLQLVQLILVWTL